MSSSLVSQGRNEDRPNIVTWCLSALFSKKFFWSTFGNNSCFFLSVFFQKRTTSGRKDEGRAKASEWASGSRRGNWKKRDRQGGTWPESVTVGAFSLVLSFPFCYLLAGLFLPVRLVLLERVARCFRRFAVQAGCKKALHADDVRGEIKSLWKILTFLLDVAISNANYKNRQWLVRADIWLRGRDFAKTIDYNIMENDEKCTKLVELYTSILT